MAISLNTGKMGFPIEFDNGEKTIIYFNPNDPNLAVRLNNLQENVEKRVGDLDKFALNEHGKPTDGATKDDIKIFENAQEVVYEEIDKAFMGDISSKIFAYCSPFALIDGEYFFIQFMTAIAPEIEKEIKKAKEKSKQKMAKYLDKYGKK